MADFSLVVDMRPLCLAWAKSIALDSIIRNTNIRVFFTNFPPFFLTQIEMVNRHYKLAAQLGGVTACSPRPVVRTGAVYDQGRRYPRKIASSARDSLTPLDAGVRYDANFCTPLLTSRLGSRLGRRVRLRLGILEHSSSRLTPQPASFDVLRQQRAGAEFFSEAFVQVFEDVEAGVEADEIDELKRAHGMIQA